MMRNSSFDMPKLNHEDARKLLFQIQEFIATELGFIDKMTQLEISIQSKSHGSKLSASEQLLCENSRQNCQRIITAKEVFRHELIRLLDDATSLLNTGSPHSVIFVGQDAIVDSAECAVNDLVSLYLRTSYQVYCQAIMDAVPNFAKLSTLMQDDKLGICGLLINATQRIPRHRLFFEALYKKYGSSDVHSALDMSEKNGLYLNKTISLDEVDQALAGHNIRAKKEIGLNLILKLQLNSYTMNEDAKQHYSGDFLQSVLRQAYPHKFGQRDGQFIGLGIAQRMIDAALDLPSATLQPEHFSAEALDALWHATKKPIWRVLKSTKPVDSHFSMIQKLQSYQQVIDCIQRGALGKKNKAALVWTEAANMMRVLQHHPNQPFSEELLSILTGLKRQLDNLSSMTMFEKLQRFMPLFDTSAVLTVEKKQLLSDLQRLINEQEDERPSMYALPIHIKAHRSKNQVKITPEPVFTIVKPQKDILKIDDIEIDMDTDTDDGSSPHG